jgi:hypothetical protein
MVVKLKEMKNNINRCGLSKMIGVGRLAAMDDLFVLTR